jgi:hypothetical protein
MKHAQHCAKGNTRMAVATKQNTGGQVLSEDPVFIVRPGDVLASDVEVVRLTAALNEVNTRLAKAEKADGDESLSVADLVAAKTEAAACADVKAGIVQSLAAAKKRALHQRAKELTSEAVQLHALYASLRAPAEQDMLAFRDHVTNAGPAYNVTDEQIDAAITGFTRWLPVAVRCARIKSRIDHLENNARNLRQIADDPRPGNVEYSSN